MWIFYVGKRDRHCSFPGRSFPEADYLVATHLGREAAQALRNDLAEGLFTLDWEGAADLERARELNETYADLSLGLVNGIVMATAERLGARAIATLDLRDFAPVQLVGRPELWPRDL